MGCRFGSRKSPYGRQEYQISNAIINIILSKASCVHDGLLAVVGTASELLPAVFGGADEVDGGGKRYIGGGFAVYHQSQQFNKSN